LARAADGSATAVRLVAVLERGAVHPGLEVLFGPPARVDEIDVTAVGRSHELEGLEARGLRHLPGPGREPALELLDPVGRDCDGVDADDAHAPPVAGASSRFAVAVGTRRRCLPLYRLGRTGPSPAPGAGPQKMADGRVWQDGQVRGLLASREGKYPLRDPFGEARRSWRSGTSGPGAQFGESAGRPCPGPSTRLFCAPFRWRRRRGRSPPRSSSTLLAQEPLDLRRQLVAAPDLPPAPPPF